jgi:hypothetical protein
MKKYFLMGIPFLFFISCAGLQTVDGNGTGTTSSTNSIVLSDVLLTDGFETTSLGESPANLNATNENWWRAGTTYGSYSVYVTNVYFSEGAKSLFLNGNCTTNYWILSTGTSVDKMVPGGAGTGAPVDLTGFSRLRFFFTCLFSAKSKLSISFMDNNLSDPSNSASGTVAKWDSNGYPTFWINSTPVEPGAWIEVQLKWSGSDQSNSNSNQFNRDRYNGRQDTTNFDWHSVVNFTISVGATDSPGDGQGTYVIDEIMLLR